MTNSFGLKHYISFVTRIAFSFAIIVSLAFFSPHTNASSLPPNESHTDVVDFEKSFDARTLQQMGFEEGQVQFVQSESRINGERVAIEVLRGELQQQNTHKLTSVLNHLAPQLREAYNANPEMKFQFNYVTESGNNTLDIHGEELLEILKSIDPNTKLHEEEISSTVANRFRNLLSKMFNPQTYSSAVTRALDKTSKSDVMWSAMRFTFAGGASTFAFTLSDIPLPTSLVLGVSLGLGSGGVGLFIEKFTGWLDSNKVEPGRKLNHIASRETLMLLSPLLIALQGTGVATPEGAALLVGYATATVVVQNAYHILKKHSPTGAMWYKWFAVEALFLATPYLMMPMWDIYTKSVTETLMSTFLFALYSTSSQGVWDILITKLRKPYLEAAIKKDLAEMSERLKGVDTTKLSPREIDALTRKEEFKVRAPYKKYFFAASFISVTSAIAGNTGAYMQINGLETFGKAGLFALGATGAISWITHIIKNRDRSKTVKDRIENLRPRVQGPACSRLFSM